MDNKTDMRRPAFRSGQNLKDGDTGFTLIEMLVSISILTVIMAGMFSFLWGASKHWHTGQNTEEVTENARMGLNRMTRELRQASQVVTAETYKVVFDVNFGVTPETKETITYDFRPGTGDQPGSIWRSTTANPGPPVILVNDVVNDVENMQVFTYYGNDYKCDSGLKDGTITWDELQACSSSPAAKVARVDISLTLKAGSENNQTFIDQAWLRNRSSSS